MSNWQQEFLDTPAVKDILDKNPFLSDNIVLVMERAEFLYLLQIPNSVKPKAPFPWYLEFREGFLQGYSSCTSLKYSQLLKELNILLQEYLQGDCAIADGGST